MFLTLQELRYSKFKFSALTFIIFLIVFLVLFITGLANGLANDSGSTLKAFDAEYFVLQKDADARLNRSNLTPSAWQTLKAQPNDAQLGVQSATIQQATGKKLKTDITYFVVNPDGFLAPKIRQDQAMRAKNTAQVVVSRKLQAAGYQLGDWLVDTTSQQRFKISGFTDATAYSHTPVIYLNTHQAQRIIANTTPQFNAVVTRQKPAQQAGYQVLTSKQVITAIPGYAAEQQSLYLMIGFLYVISLFVLAIFFYIMTLQKQNNFGILKAIGTQTSYLVGHLITEIACLALIAIALTNLAISLISTMMPTSMPFSLTPAVQGGTSLIFLVVAILSALLSLVQVTKIDPISAIGGHI